MTVLATDVSNYTDPLTPDALEAWKAAGIELVIIQAINPPAGFPAGKTTDQIQQCLAAELVVDAYIFLWFDLTSSDIAAKLGLLTGYPVRRVWLDVEDSAASKYSQADTEAKIQSALDLCDGLNGGKTGIYTGRWWWTDPNYMANSTTFGDRDLWDSQYDGIPDISGFQPYGGWSQRAIKQFVGSTSFAGISGIDMNVLSDQEASALGQPVDPPANIDQGWLDRKDEIVGLAGELKTVSDQIRAAAKRKGGPVRSDILPLADAVQSRADQILGG